MLLLCLYIFIEYVKGIVIGIFVCCNILFCIAVKDKKIKYLFLSFHHVSFVFDPNGNLHFTVMLNS